MSPDIQAGAAEGSPSEPSAKPSAITPENIEELLLAGKVEIAMATGHWLPITLRGEVSRWGEGKLHLSFSYGEGGKYWGSLSHHDFPLREEFFRATPGR